MSRDSERARRLALRKAAKGLLGPLRGLVRDLAEFERLSDADPFGVVRIQPSEDAEADYAADVLDLVAQAVGEAGRNRVVDVFVISSATDSTHRARRPIGGSDDGSERKARIRRGRSRAGA